MSIFSPPKSDYQDAFDQSRFNFMWRMFMIMGTVFLALTGLHLFERDFPNVMITAIALGIILISLVVTKISRKYIFGAIIGGVAGSLVNQLDLFLVVGSQKFVTLMWIICITLYVFYLLGAFWGMITLIVNMIGVLLSLVVIPKEFRIEMIESTTHLDLISIIINLIVVVTLVGYLMNQILKSSRKAEQRSKITQQELRKQYVVVQAQNEEKTVMLKEIHHRVKNNLQVITSLLRLQSNEINDQKVLNHFNDAIQRVMSMALIHEKMYQSDDLSKINLTAYLKSLTEELIETYNVNREVQLTIESDIDYVQPKSLVSFALMFNELISNSMKHAFTDLENPEIKISIKTVGQEDLIITYFDNGEWKAPQKEGSFGVQLIEDLCGQLDGKYKRNTGSGTTYRFEFSSQNLAE